MAKARSYREGWLTSMKIDALRDDSAELFLFRLGLKADKNGVYHAEPELLRTAAYPLQVPRRRLADVTRFRDKCVRAGLLRYWTAADGRPYVQIIKFDQNTPNEKPIHPVPPGDPDKDGQEHFDLPEPPRLRKKLNRREERVRARGAPLPLSIDLTATESEQQWIERLQARRPDVDIAAELEIYLREQTKAARIPGRRHFENNWLPNCSTPYTGKKVPAAQSEPEGWREWLVTNHPTCMFVNDGRCVARSITELPEEIRAQCIHDLRRSA